ncbi:MAG: hypothetical protein J1E80_07175 [Desulfovibrionaceae bacterium]|nr:hypothetical protein [Desulfovibrionaceae bacterium]
MKQILGIRFSQYGQALACRAAEPEGGAPFAVGDGVMVDTERGPEFGRVAWQRPVPADTPLHAPVDAPPGAQEQPQPAGASLPSLPEARAATADEMKSGRDNEALSAEARAFCRRCIAERGLDMKLVDVETQYDRGKMIFFFTAPTRIDFRELVKDLVRQYRTRIELRQIGVRHETQMLGALGNCGMVCCCRRYLHKFAPVTIKMAKEQNLFLNPAKISGICGRLLCCLSYEQDNYDAFHRSCPRLGKRYQTDLGPMRVLRGNMFRNTVVVLPDAGQETEYSLEQWQELHPHRAETAPAPGGRAPHPGQELVVVSAAPDTLDRDLAELEPLAETARDETAPASVAAAAEARPRHRRRRRSGADQEAASREVLPGDGGDVF